MKNPSLLLLLALLLNTSIMAQENEVGTPWAGRTFSVQNTAQNDELHLQQANMQNQMMDFEETYFAYENAVARNPNSAIALLNRAKFKQRFGMTKEAAEDFRLAARMNPYIADLYAYNGPYSVLNVLSYKPESAVVNLEASEQMNKYKSFIDEAYTNIDADNLRLDYLEEIVLEIEEKRLDNALNLLEIYLDSYPNSAIGYDLQGVLYLKSKKYDAAERSLKKAIELQPEFGIAWYNYSQLAKVLGDYDSSKEYLNKAIALQENLSKAYFDRALLNKKQGNTKAAISDYSKIIEMKGDNYMEAYLNRGLTRKMLGNFDLALQDINKAIESFPDYADLYKNRGNLYVVFGYHRRAIEDYTIAIEKNPDYAEAYYNRGLAHFIIHDNVSGCYDLEKSVDLGFEEAAEKLEYFCVD